MKHMLAEHLKQCAASGADILHFGADSAVAEGELYRSDTLCVRALPGRDTSRWFITFDHLRHDLDLDRAGFGEEYFRARGISLVTVVGSGNDWYQYADIDLALATIRRALEKARARITYGTSMGGYAAIRFADAVEATACLALSPQYSIDPRTAPFEKRWEAPARAINWPDEPEGPIRCRISPIVIYDSRDDDARHAGLIATDTRLSPIAIPFAAHPTSTYLSATGLLAPIIEALHEGSFDIRTFRELAWERRKSTAMWIGELARRQPAYRPRTAEQLARNALSLAPDSDLLLHILAQILSAKNAYGEALMLHRRAYERSGRLLEYGLCYSHALQRSGSVGRAMAIAQDLHARHPRSEPLCEWIAQLHHVMGTLDQAIREAVAFDCPAWDDPYYRALLQRRRSARSLKRHLGKLWKRIRALC